MIRRKSKYWTLALVGFLTACGSSEGQTNTDVQTSESQSVQEDTEIAQKEEEIKEMTIPLDSFFTPIDTNFTTKTLLLPEGFEAKILFKEKENNVVTAFGDIAPAKGNHDMLAFIEDPQNENRGELFVSHETKYADPVLGDGGGASIFTVEKTDAEWNVVGDFNHIDFSSVRNTHRNCGGQIGPNELIYSCEEAGPKSNNSLKYKGKGHTNMDSVGSLAYFENFGWVVEIDPETKAATQKMIAMGRFMHEDLEFMDDNKTVYLSDDYEPAVFFKFVADEELNYSQGQLYAFKEGENGSSGEWLALARDTATMIRARDAAIDLGASMYMRHEWFARVGNKIYIGETGHDETDWTNRVNQGGSISHYLKPHAEGNVLKDVYGRILVFETETNTMSNHFECGVSDDGATVISNPDCVTPVNLGGKDYLIIHEDINGNDKGRVPEFAYKNGKWYCELYFLDLSLENATPNDVKRFAITPMGAEFSGGIMSPDKSTLFLNVMHPHYSNGAPYNRSVTVAITGFNKK